MRAILIDISGTLCVEAINHRNGFKAARTALANAKMEVTDSTFTDAVQEMRAARAHEPFEAAIWQVFKPHASGLGLDTRAMREAWKEIATDYRSHRGYRFVLRDEMRGLLEELKFNTADNWGDAPALIGIAEGGEMIRVALEEANLSTLFDQIGLSDEFGARISDQRFILGQIEQFNVKPEECAAIGCDIARNIGPARRLGIYTLLFSPESYSGQPAREPGEEPHACANSVKELGNLILDWINTTRPRRLL